MSQMRLVTAAKMGTGHVLAGKLKIAPATVRGEEFKATFKSAAGAGKGAVLEAAPAGVATGPAVPLAAKAGVALAVPGTTPVKGRLDSAVDTPVVTPGDAAVADSLEEPSLAVVIGPRSAPTRVLMPKSISIVGSPAHRQEGVRQTVAAVADSSPPSVSKQAAALPEKMAAQQKAAGGIDAQASQAHPEGGVRQTVTADASPATVAKHTAATPGKVVAEEKSTAPIEVQAPQPLSGTFRPVAAAPEKKIGKGPLAPVEAKAPVAVVVGQGAGAGVVAVAAPVMAAPTAMAEHTADCQEVVAETGLVPTANVVTGAQPVASVLLVQPPLSFGDEAIPTSGKIQGAVPKKSTPIVKEAPVMATPPAHWEVPAEKPVTHGNLLQAPTQRADVPLAAMMAPSPQTTPVVNATVPALAAPVVATHLAASAGGHLELTPAEPASAAQPGDARTLSSTPLTLEVGVSTGTHGWLRVRAEMGDGGAVVASVVASSPVAAEALHRGLPAMHEYLVHEQVGIASVAISNSSLPAESGDGGGSAGLDQPAGRQDARDQSSTPGQPANSSGGWDDKDASFQTGLQELPFLYARSGGGSWLSVRV